MTYCRTDLCPKCSTRLNGIHEKHDPRWDHITIVDYPIYTTYKDMICKTVKCFGCYNVFAKEQVYDYWAEYMRDHND